MSHAYVFVLCFSFFSCGTDYVDEVFGDKSLWPTNPYQKALGKLLVSNFGNEVCVNIYVLTVRQACIEVVNAWQYYRSYS